MFHIINTILQAPKYIHTNNVLHNYFYTYNIFIHFSKKKDEFYARVGDLGYSTLINIAMHVGPLQSNDIAMKREAKTNWPWMAQECL